MKKFIQEIVAMKKFIQEIAIFSKKYHSLVAR